MIARFFIDRPVFAAVISIAITLAGALAVFSLPLAMYPQIAPPTVQVDCKYPGASAREVAETVAAPIEQEVNGVEGMLYMSSQCTNDGSYNLTITFAHGTDQDMAQVLVQNRVALALPRLPEVIKQAGVTARKRSPDILLAIAINSPTGRYDQLYLSNYASMRLREELLRLPGVSDVGMLGQQNYSMRIWLDPDRLAARGMTAGDVVAALRDENQQVAAGQIGQPPTPAGQAAQLTIDTLGRLSEPGQFERIVVKVGDHGQLVRLKDVARVELGARSVDVTSRVNGHPSASMAIWLLPDANALETGDRVKARIVELARDFPEGMRYEIRYDTTPFIRESIGEVFKSLQESVILVAVVVLLFLQNWRSAVIPLVAVPVAIIGTFAVMAALGFSLNNLTLFGLVLSIGIVVDDAIVVVEAVEHHMERGLAPRRATIVAMEEVSGPVIAIGLVLTAVFVPCAFISGIVGQFFRQFALTIAASTLISTLNSLTLSPALAALLLKPPSADRRSAPPAPLPRIGIAALGAWAGWGVAAPRVREILAGRGVALSSAPGWAVPLGTAVVLGWLAWVLGGLINRVLAALFAGFDAAFRRVTGGYVRSVAVLLRAMPVGLLIYGGLLYLTYYGARLDLPLPEGYAPREVKVPGFATTPKGFIPTQDMGYALVNVQLPDSAALERTQAVMDRIEQVARTIPGVKHTQTTTGQSLLLSAFGPNFGSMFVIFDEFSKRRTPELYGEAIIGELRKRFGEVAEGRITVLGPPPVRGVGRAGGFKVMVEDRGDNTLETLQAQAEGLARAGNELTIAGRKPLTDLTSVFSAKVPQLFARVDRKEAMIKRVDLQDLFRTMQVYLGSLYVNDFNRFGRTWQVIAQADAPFRSTAEAVRRLKVRNADGKMVPVGSLAQVEETNGPLVLTRYNMHTAAPVNGSAAPGTSSGDAIAAVDELARRELLPTMATEWTELAYLELQAGNTAMIVFGFAVAMVFLVLAAQYESWALPLAVILVVPLCLLSALAGVNLAGQDVNIFTQIGFVVLAGLACKNAILIVEFARSQRLAGVPRRQAALEACRLRLRPIVMTSLAFILGTLPLLVAHGAGAEMRRTLGTTVFSGMLGVTIFGVLLTPVFFVLVDWLASTALFRSRAARWVASILLGVFALGYARRLAVWTASRRPWRRRGRPRPTPVGAANGHAANGHASPPALPAEPVPAGERSPSS